MKESREACCQQLADTCKKINEAFFAVKEEEIFADFKQDSLSSYLLKHKRKRIVSKLNLESLLTILMSSGYSISLDKYRVVDEEDVVSFGEESNDRELFSDDIYLAKKGKSLIHIFIVPEGKEEYFEQCFDKKDEYGKYSLYTPSVDVPPDTTNRLAVISVSGLGLGPRKYNSYVWLNSVFKDFKETKEAQILKDCFNYLKQVDKYKKNDLFRLDKKRYIDKLFSFVEDDLTSPVDKNTYELASPSNLELIKSFVYESEWAEDIVKLIGTYITFNSSLNKLGDDTMLDYSSVILGLYKTAEIVFYELLIRRWDGFNYRNSNKQIVYKDISNRSKTTLGDCCCIFYSTDEDVLDILKKHDYKEINKTIQSWIAFDRNDHAHKDIMQIRKELEQSLHSTINVTYKLIKLFK